MRAREGNHDATGIGCSVDRAMSGWAATARPGSQWFLPSRRLARGRRRPLIGRIGANGVPVVALRGLWVPKTSSAGRIDAKRAGERLSLSKA
jgi:hypothetical protein